MRHPQKEPLIDLNPLVNVNGTSNDLGQLGVDILNWYPKTPEKSENVVEGSVMPSKFSVRKRNRIFDNYDICCKICKKNIFFKIFAETTEQQYRNVIHYIIRKKDFCY